MLTDSRSTSEEWC